MVLMVNSPMPYAMFFASKILSRYQRYASLQFVVFLDLIAPEPESCRFVLVM
jgi:hypothetical protein